MSKVNTVNVPDLTAAIDTEEATVETTRLKAGKYETQRVFLPREAFEAGVLFTARNWRAPEDLQQRAIELGRSLLDQGQQTPIWAMPYGPFDPSDIENARLRIIRGHSRDAGFRHILATSGAEVFDEAFPDGVAVEVFLNITPQEASLLAMDNAATVNMETARDLQEAANVMIAEGCTAKDFMLALEPLTSKLYPLDKSEGGREAIQIRAKIHDLHEQLAVEGLPQATRDFMRKQVRELEQAYNDKVYDVRRGVRDMLLNHWNAGPLADYMQHFKQFQRVHPDAPEGVPFEHLGYSKSLIQALSKAARADAGVKGRLSEQQREVVGRGERYRAEWQKAVKKAQEKAGKPKPEKRAKALSGSQLEELASGKSSGVAKVLRAVREGNETLAQSLVNEADSLLQVAELVSSEDPDFWSTVVVRYRELRKARSAEAAEAIKVQDKPKRKRKK